MAAIVLTIGFSANSRFIICTGQCLVCVRVNTTCQHSMWKRLWHGAMSFNHLVLKDRTVFPYSSAFIKAINTAKALKRKEKKKKLGRFLYFLCKKNKISLIFFFFTITKISSKHTDPTVSLLNYIERVQPLTVNGAHQS